MIVSDGAQRAWVEPARPPLNPPLAQLYRVVYATRHLSRAGADWLFKPVLAN